MKFLPLFLISSVLALLFNGLDAFKDDLAHQFHVAKKHVMMQAERVASLQGSFDVIKSVDRSRCEQVDKASKLVRHVYEQRKPIAQQAYFAPNLLRALKAKMESLNSQVVRAEKVLHEFKVAGNLPHQKAVDAEKLLHSAKSEGKSIGKKLEMAEELLNKEEHESKKRRTKKYDMAEKLVFTLWNECVMQAEEVRKAEELLEDVKKIDKSLAHKLNDYEPLLREDPEDRETEEIKDADGEIDGIKDEIKTQDERIAKTEKLLHHVTHWAGEHANKVVKAEELLHDAKAENESQAKEIAAVRKLLHEARDEAVLQVKNIAQAEKLLGV